jgi:hypothetical protein
MSVFKLLRNRPFGYAVSGILVTFRGLLCFQLSGTHEMEVVLESKVENTSPTFLGLTN